MTWSRLFPVLHVVLFAGLLIAWTIALLSPVPHQSAERVLGGEFWVWLFGKTLHVSAYAVLAILGASLPVARRNWLWILIGLVGHGAMTEFFQQFVGRTSSVRDAALDGLGVVIGGLLVWSGRRLVGRTAK